MTSEHQPANPVSNEDLQAENRRLRQQLDAARDAVASIRASLNQLAATFDQGPDYRERCRAAAQWVEELLVIPTSQPGTPMASQVDMLGEELQGILDVLTAQGGDRQ
jgi:cell division septum initiation protein DivIVA